MEPQANLETFLTSIRKEFYRFRNGIVSDAIKKLYPEGTLIFGLTIPQFQEVSKSYEKNLELARRLWQDKKTRESRILALYLFPIECIDKEEAKQMILDVQSSEEADLLAFKVLRYLPFARSFYQELVQKYPSFNKLSQYTLEMFKKNLEALK